jgi:hypothetical protein
MGKAHQIQKKTAQPTRTTIEQATWKKINTINRKQTPHVQSITQTHADLWKSAMGASLQFLHRNLPGLSIQASLIHSEYMLVYKQPHDP